MARPTPLAIGLQRISRYYRVYCMFNIVCLWLCSSMLQIAGFALLHKYLRKNLSHMKQPTQHSKTQGWYCPKSICCALVQHELLLACSSPTAHYWGAMSICAEPMNMPPTSEETFGCIYDRHKASCQSLLATHDKP